MHEGPPSLGPGRSPTEAVERVRELLAPLGRSERGRHSATSRSHTAPLRLSLSSRRTLEEGS